MKNNTQQSKQFLTQAIQALPEDFALGSARSHLRAALNEIQKIEGRRVQREELNKQVELSNLEKSIIGGGNYDAREAIGVIDELISQEKKNLIAIQERNKQQQDSVDDEDVQTLHD